MLSPLDQIQGLERSTNRPQSLCQVWHSVVQIFVRNSVFILQAPVLPLSAEQCYSQERGKFKECLGRENFLVLFLLFNPKLKLKNELKSKNCWLSASYLNITIFC